MLNEFVPYEIALELKDLGFNEECLACYNQSLNNMFYFFVDSENVSIDELKAPLYQQAFKFLREKLDVFTVIDRYYKDGWRKHKYTYYIYFGAVKLHTSMYESFEKCQYDCLKHAINNYKDYEEHKRINKINIRDAEN